MAPAVYQTSHPAAARLGWQTVAALAAATVAILLLLSLSAVTGPVPVTAAADDSGDPFVAAEAWAAEAAPNFPEILAAGVEREAALPPVVPIVWSEGALMEGHEGTGRLVSRVDVTIDVKPGWKVWAVSADGSEREICSGCVGKVAGLRVRNESCGPNPVLADSAVIVRQTR